MAAARSGLLTRRRRSRRAGTRACPAARRQGQPRSRRSNCWRGAARRSSRACASSARARDWARARAGAAGARDRRAARGTERRAPGLGRTGARPAAGDGRRQRHARQLLRRRRLPRARRAPSPTAARSSRRAPTSSISAASPPGPAPRPVAPEEELTAHRAGAARARQPRAPSSRSTRATPRSMAMALAAGARIVNDVTALAGDPASLGTVARSGAAVVLMHMQGEPATMQRDAALWARVARRARIPGGADRGLRGGRHRARAHRRRSRHRLRQAERHNLEILARLALFHALGAAA